MATEKSKTEREKRMFLDFFRKGRYKSLLINLLQRYENFLRNMLFRESNLLLEENQHTCFVVTIVPFKKTIKTLNGYILVFLFNTKTTHFNFTAFYKLIIL